MTLVARVGIWSTSNADSGYRAVNSCILIDGKTIDAEVREAADCTESQLYKAEKLIAHSSPTRKQQYGTEIFLSYP